MIASLSSLIERLETGTSPDEELDEDLRAYALAGKPAWLDHETPRLTAKIDQAIALPNFLGINDWIPIMRNIGNIAKWTAAAKLAEAGDESPFCRRFLIAVLNASKEITP